MTGIGGEKWTFERAAHEVDRWSKARYFAAESWNYSVLPDKEIASVIHALRLS